MVVLASVKNWFDPLGTARVSCMWRFSILRWCFLVCCLVPSRWAARAAGCVANSTRINLTLGFMFPLFKTDANGDVVRATSSGFERCAAALLAVEHINRGTSLISGVPGKLNGCVHIDVCPIKNTEASPGTALGAAFELGSGNTAAACDGKTIDAVIGPSGSSTSFKASPVLALYKIPTVSFASTADSLSSKRLFPYFARTVPPDSLQASAILDAVLGFKWKKVGIFFDKDDHYSNGLYHTFTSLASGERYNVAMTPFPYDHALAADENKSKAEQLKLMRGSKARIFIVFLSTTAAVTKIMKAAKGEFFGHRDYAWVLSDGTAKPSLITAMGNDEGLHGVLGVLPYSESSRQYPSFVKDLWKHSLAWNNHTFKMIRDSIPNGTYTALLGSAGSFQKDPNAKIPYAYDAVLAVALAAQIGTAEPQYQGRARSELSRTIMDVFISGKVQFSDGLSGPVSINENADNVAVPFLFVNFQDESKGATVSSSVPRTISMKTAGVWTPAGFEGGADSLVRNVSFYGGYGYVPSDGVPRPKSSSLPAPIEHLPSWAIALLVCLGILLFLAVTIAARIALTKYRTRQKNGWVEVDSTVWWKSYAVNIFVRVVQVTNKFIFAGMEIVNLQTIETTANDQNGLYDVADSYKVFLGLYLASVVFEMLTKLNEVRIDLEIYFKGISIDSKSMRYGGVRKSPRVTNITSTGDPDVALKKTSQRLRFAYFYATQLFIKTIPFFVLKMYLVIMDAQADGVKYHCDFATGCKPAGSVSEGGGANIVNLLLLCILATTMENEFEQLKSLPSLRGRKRRLKAIIQQYQEGNKSDAVASNRVSVLTVLEMSEMIGNPMISGQESANFKKSTNKQTVFKKSTNKKTAGGRMENDEFQVRVEELMMSTK
jgi:ABC-type branched-subunit amino acid transport system substrate-binding protein